MLFDTDILIWFFRGNEKAAQIVDYDSSRALSIVSYMELLQGSRSRKEMTLIKSFLKEFNFSTIPLTENIGHRAAIYMEEFVLRVALSPADALIAASAVETNLILATGNKKHFHVIPDLNLKLFQP